MKTKVLLSTLALAALPAAAFAQEAAPSFDEIGPYIMTTLLFCMAGFLVFFMAAGFAMLEGGLVRSKNVTMQMTKNIALYSVAAIMYWLIGFNLMYPGDFNGYVGSFFVPTVLDPVGVSAADAALDYASIGSDFFFQLVFVAATASIVSGALAERIKLWPFLAFVVILTGVMYPISGSWQWGGGWLSEAGFSDFAGSTVVHSVGGWAALAGAIILGPRLGKYSKEGKVTPMPGSNLALATLGTFILWLGWFGFNGGSQLAMGTVGDVSDVSRIFANTNMAAAAGAVTALVMTQLLYKKPDLTMVLNGALAGLVSITAEPLAPTLFGALWIGSVGGVIVVLAVPLLDKLKIDDVVGAIPVHLFAGIWGTIAVIFYNGDAALGTQLLGIAAYGVFTFVGALIVWIILKAIVGIRVSEEDELVGLDKAELGMEAYPEFANS
ncbi:ammonium transporter [Thalassobacter stenotrophicus]|jgi:Amt family ammonium transporter|uniref:Ammonium transporter n=2 Tax=Thalassobacter stenotrophicus TaxID=266809 RepID=A0A0P1EYM2_9RHOB|nr:MULTISPECIES: ammonium transporter [Thalassobacter]KGK79617.1 ammonium transporter [Thalassobacter stenotrophicus]KGL01442.1 ammonium transporter [Thalassobacter sp. 16PALIMAR09]PVZ49745.1 ammonium transporter [Thalassobacter stenotrophicus]UYP67877.1 ammonium transporter [Thalassobacter stenotrophicus]CUH59812.1 Ammonia transporter [Thalassobacter stenotrophicus]